MYTQTHTHKHTHTCLTHTRHTEWEREKRRERERGGICAGEKNNNLLLVTPDANLIVLHQRGVVTCIPGVRGDNHNCITKREYWSYLSYLSKPALTLHTKVELVHRKQFNNHTKLVVNCVDCKEKRAIFSLTFPSPSVNLKLLQGYII